MLSVTVTLQVSQDYKTRDLYFMRDCNEGGMTLI
jgi:hypothetical protein